MDLPSENGRFIDHHGQLHALPPGLKPRTRTGIHAVLRVAGNVLLVQPPGADWLELPGGGLEPGETHSQALCRELLEEAGLVLPVGSGERDRDVAFTSRYYSSNNQQYWIYRQTFRLIQLAIEPPLRPPLEAGHRRLWLSLGELNDKPLHHVHRIGLQRLLGISHDGVDTTGC